MRFSQLINSLQKAGAVLHDYKIANDPEIVNGASIEKAQSQQISFLELGNPLINEFDSTNASAVLLPNQDVLKQKANKMEIAWAVLNDPRLGFAECLELLNPKPIYEPGIHKTAVIGKNVILGKQIFVGPNVSIGSNCQIGDNTIIHAGVVLYNDVKIGNQCVLHGNCVLHRKSMLNDNCVIHSNAVIGSEGFGFVPTKNGWKKMPQTGSVILEEDVEVGCSTTIDRPSVGETRIGAGTKIDNLVQIGHGVVTGKGCAMASQVGIAGGAQLGDGVILAGQVGVANRVKVGDRVIASSKCGIHADVEAEQVISGFPAMPNKLWLRCSTHFKRLPEITKTIRQLTRSDST